MTSLHEAVFSRLRDILIMHCSTFSVTGDATRRYCLEAPVGPATLRAWGGRLRTPMIPVAWAEIQKSYVSYHLMGLQGNPRLAAKLSERLHARMQGKSCFKFTAVDESLMQELERVTAESLSNMRSGGYIVDSRPQEGG